MKKLFNGRFLFILASSLIVLIGLGLGAFLLFNDSDDTFVKSGYVLNPLSSTTEKYFFEEDTGYKENLSSMVEFVDVDDKTVSVLKDSFLHYDDESISFLKKGAILDLDSIKGDKAVLFYNIKPDVMIEKKDSGYIINAAGGEIKLKNFIGRISDDKYIVVGDLNLKMAGNATTIKGDYFEVVYVEEGIVNIENKDIKYQVTAEGTLIYVGNDKTIDLGDKKITVNGVDLLSITSITIDGDENIEVIPKGNEEEDSSGSGQGEDGEGAGGTSGGGAGEGDGEGGTGEDSSPEIEEVEEVVISIQDVAIGSTNIDVTFEILNARSDDSFKLQVINLATGRTVDMVASVVSGVKIKVNLLTPNTKYLFAVVNERDNGKYFQKVIETSGFGIKLEKMYATDNSLAFKVSVDKDTDISNAKLTLYKFNEETMQNEVVTKTYVDSTTGSVTEYKMITLLSSIESTLEGEHEVVYDGLDSNTIYTAVLDEFSVASSNFKDIYNITLTSMTLKRIPNFSEMTISKNVGDGSFDLSLGNITDPDSAIVKYTYLIYDKISGERVIDPIYQTNASPITVKVGDKPNQLKNDTNYFYKVIIEYYDNEKYIEYVTSDSITFLMGNDPYITVTNDTKLTTHNQLGAKIKLTDNSCLVSMPGRERCSGPSTAVVEVSRVNPVTGELTVVYTKLITFEIVDDELVYNLFVEKLQPGTTYNIDVKATLNNGDGLEKKEIMHTDDSNRLINTKALSSFNVVWENKNSSEDFVVNAKAQLIADASSGTMTPEESIATIDRIELRLYEGRKIVDYDLTVPVGRRTLRNSEVFKLKEEIYDKSYDINSTYTFGLNMQALIDASVDGKLNEYYTIYVEAYTKDNYPVTLYNNAYAYKVNPFLLEPIEAPVIQVTGISNKDAGTPFKNLTNLGTYVGYRVSAAFDRNALVATGHTPQQIFFYVYDAVTKKKVSFYVKIGDNFTKVDRISGYLEENNFFDTELYMDYGLAYEESDNIMRRGNKYYIGYEILTVEDGTNQVYMFPNLSDPNIPAENGLYKLVEADKETPSIKIYPSKSDANSITYNYTIIDADNALYKLPESDVYSAYSQVNSGEVVSHTLEKVSGLEYNEFTGQVKINDLTPGSIYNLYFNINLNRSGNFEDDVVKYTTDGKGSGYRLFDGYYDAKTNIDSYNFKYQVINNPVKDNKVIIKILANNDILNRIMSYRLKFTDSTGKVVEKELWQLSVCDGESETSTPRCLSVDYTELKEMKSSNTTNLITVSVTALYDNGLTGYDFVVGQNKENHDYLYCIMQDNSSEQGMGNYISFTASGAQLTVWSDTLGAPKNYYTYSFINNNQKMILVGHYNNYTTNFQIGLTAAGYTTKYGFANPKMVSLDEMACDGKDDSCNKFSFSSIIPKVSVSEKATLINGNVLNLKLSGVNLEDIKKEDGEYYLYVETFESEPGEFGVDGSGSIAVRGQFRPRVKVKINRGVPTNAVSVLIDGLEANQKHYFQVYAYMNSGNNKYAYTQLFDAGVKDDYVPKTYSFATAKPGDIFHSFTVSTEASEEIYGNRSLSTKMNLLAYKNNIAFNFGIVYILCEVGTECDPDVDGSYIFKKSVDPNDVATSFTDVMDVSEYDLEYNKNYLMRIYANALYYDSPDHEGSQNVLLNRMTASIKLKKLNEPSFVGTREAGIDASGKYYIDFNVVVNDLDRTLVDGKYYVKLIDSNGSLCGSMQLQDQSGAYYDVSNYGEYAFDAFVVSKNIRITNLEPDKKYTFVIYNDAYLNNYSEEIPKEERYVEIRKTYTVYTTNIYGVAFGRDITYSATAKSIIVTFLGGSNFNNVKEVNYTVGRWDDQTNASTLSGTFIIGENNKAFELYRDTSDWRFVIDPEGMLNTLGQTYNVNISFKVLDPATGNFVVLTNADVPGFEGKVIYVED